MLKSNPPKISASKSSLWIAGVLLISLVLRWLLIFHGGQYYFSDEQRYEASRMVVDQSLQNETKEAFAQLFIWPEHIGFKIIGIIPAMMERFTGETLKIPALFFSLFSVLNLYLIFGILKRSGASEKVSLYALILAACCMSLLYYARHLMPYDLAMTFGLLALYVAIAEKPDAKTSLACGGFSFLCFITYNGYWSLSGFAMLAHALAGNTNILEHIKKGLVAALGFILPAILLMAAANWLGIDILEEYQVFATSINQGSYAEGWSLPFEYLWHTEHFLFLLLGLLSLYAMMRSSREKSKTLYLWGAGLVFIYFCLLISSVFLHSFVVYGRLARQMVPFLILLSASGLVKLEEGFSIGKVFARLALAIIFIQAAWNYQASYALSYPREFARDAKSLYPGFVFSEKRFAFGAPTQCRYNGYISEYVKRFVTPPEANPPVQGELLLSAPHPDNFLPYQYEGYTYEERQRFRGLNIEMKFYRADSEFTSSKNPVWVEMKNCLVKEE